MHKHAYLRPDGRYDLYDVEPVIVTAAEYATLKKVEELKARQEQLRISRDKIDAELATVATELAALENVPTESTEPTSAAAMATSTAAETSGKRKW